MNCSFSNAAATMKSFSRFFFLLNFLNNKKKTAATSPSSGKKTKGKNKKKLLNSQTGFSNATLFFFYFFQTKGDSSRYIFQQNSFADFFLFCVIDGNLTFNVQSSTRNNLAFVQGNHALYVFYNCIFFCLRFAMKR